MTFDVQLTLGAERDLEVLYDWTVLNRSLGEADELLDALMARAASLVEFPLKGAVPKELQVLGISEFRQVLLSPYRVIYRVVGDAVFIVMIADGRRDMQALLERRILE